MENTEVKNLQQSELFKNRITKNYKQQKKWARKNRISCMRLYDRDIPEIPLAVDLYVFLPDDITTKEECARYLIETNAVLSENKKEAAFVKEAEKSRTWALLYLYERPYEKDEKEEELWLSLMKKTLSQALEIDESHVIEKIRRHQSAEGKRDQYEKTDSQCIIKGITQEQGQLFSLNLTEYLDTGLFLDHRPLRKIIRETCRGKTVLNLFCYTGSFSVYAAEGGAKRIESVDMSNTYLDWAKENFRLNGFDDEARYVFTRQDATGFLNQKNAEVANKDRTNRFDIIILDPPTFSNSKRTEHTLDINRDWSSLVAKCFSILNDGGILYFSTNSRRLSFDQALLPEGAEVQDITAQSVPEDYRNRKIHRCWKITRA